LHAPVVPHQTCKLLKRFVQTSVTALIRAAADTETKEKSGGKGGMIAGIAAGVVGLLLILMGFCLYRYCTVKDDTVIDPSQAHHNQAVAPLPRS
jgi:hypothetical protein